MVHFRPRAMSLRTLLRLAELIPRCNYLLYVLLTFTFTDAAYWITVFDRLIFKSPFRINSVMVPFSFYWKFIKLAVSKYLIHYFENHWSERDNNYPTETI